MWLGWMEDPDNADAKRLKHERLGSSRTQEVLQYLKTRGETVYYWRGGDGPATLSGVTGARVFFLGPPTPQADLAEAHSAIKAMSGRVGPPFDASFRVSRQEAEKRPEFAAYFGSSPVRPEEVQWRQITPESLRPVAAVRLGAQHEINNTSLAMAIELSGPRRESRVLLFPGDAQLSSWFSWHEHRWPADAPPDDPRTVTCRKLIESTVVYKVSHYGSHSGTPRQFGHEMMTHPELAALLPGDQAAAQKRLWRMPAPGLLMALARKTRGRVIRTDAGLVPTAAYQPLNEDEQARYRSAVNVESLFIDYFVDFPRPSAAEQRQFESSWNAANERRIFLIDRKLAGTIKVEEEAELRGIERIMDEQLRQSVPRTIGVLSDLQDPTPRRR